MEIIFWLIIGLIAGGVASLIVPGRTPGGAIGALVVGVLGGLLGGWLLAALDVAEGLTFLGALLVAIVGAVAILYALRATGSERI
ncbi:MAG TPA: GlsB/YeaQ/YmgE family stress response membrane protein [Methylomirabilota bacterium]|nr:GlsB/YeaQ/YmgE family stress response membrane protein [Methylomirabilota bacterium]